MPTPVRLLVVLLGATGFGALTWGVGGLLHWDAPLIQQGFTTYMDARGAIGIGVGALAGAAIAVALFRDKPTSASSEKHLPRSHELS